MTTHITEEHRRAFEALTSGAYSNFALFSVFIDGAPGAALVAVDESTRGEEGGESEYELLPLFVSPTSGMTIAVHDGRAA